MFFCWGAYKVYEYKKSKKGDKAEKEGLAKAWLSGQCEKHGWDVPEEWK